MKRLFTLFYLYLILPQVVLYSQWETTNGKWSDIQTIEFIDDGIIASSKHTIYKSINKGSDWQLFNGDCNYDLSEIIDIKSCNDSLFVLSKYSLFLTSDKGANWIKYNDSLWSNRFLRNIQITEDFIYICSDNALYLMNKNDGILKKISDTIEVSLSTVFVKSDTIILGGAYSTSKPKNPKIFISTNNGENWTFIFDTTASNFGKSTINSIERNNNYVFAGTTAGVYISTNHGYDWAVAGLENNEINCLKIINDKIYAGASDGLYVSDNNGQSWNQKKQGLTYIQGGVYKTYEVNSINNYEDDIFIGAKYGGIFLSNDEGESWSPASNGLGGGLIFDIDSDGSILYAGSYGYGLFISTDSGLIWNKVLDKTNDPIEEILLRSIIRIAADKNNIYIAHYGNGFSYSNDYGKTWQQPPDNALVNKSSKIKDIKINNSKVYAAHSEGIFISPDNGENWEYGPKELGGQFIISMAFKENIGIIGVKDNRTFISLDFGNTWKSSYNGLPDSCSIVSVAISGNNLYAGTNHYNTSENFVQYGDGVYLSTDFGENWVDINDSITRNYRISSIDVIDSNIFICSKDRDGIFLSTNNGGSWRSINEGLGSFALEKLFILKEYIFAATSDGIYRAKLSDFGITSVSENNIDNNYLYAFPPYPQPANQQVSSKIYWDTSIDILDDEIGVYDIYGQKVAGKESITIDRLTAYSGILKWDCSGVQSGVYLIHVKHGSRSWTLKVMVNK